MEGGPKSLNAGLKFDDDGKDGEGTEEPGQTENTLNHKKMIFAPEIILFCVLFSCGFSSKKTVSTWWCVVGAGWCRSYGFITHGDIG